MNKLKQEYNNINVPPELLPKLEATISAAKRQKRRTAHIQKTITSIAAVLLVFAILPNTTPQIAATLYDTPVLGPLFKIVTIRSYTEETPKNHIDIKIPSLTLDEVSEGMSPAALLNAEKSVSYINQNILLKTNSFTRYCEENLSDSYGTPYDININSYTLTDNDTVFCMKLSIYEASASGYQRNIYYCIDKQTGKLISLKDIFGDDYISIISQNIKTQMIQLMKDNNCLTYFISDDPSSGNGFFEITPDQQFYIDSNGNIIISFDESTIAPSSMGIQEFIIGTYTN